jgi:hypothetical protein
LARLHTPNQIRKRLQPGLVGAKTSNKASGLSGPSSGWLEPGSLARPSRAGISNTPGDSSNGVVVDVVGLKGTTGNHQAARSPAATWAPKRGRSLAPARGGEDGEGGVEGEASPLLLRLRTVEEGARRCAPHFHSGPPSRACDAERHHLRRGALSRICTAEYHRTPLAEERVDERLHAVPLLWRGRQHGRTGPSARDYGREMGPAFNG